MINFVHTKKQILLVDQDQAVTDKLAALFESRGYAVKVAKSGAEALQKANSATDLILIDILLPDQAGFQVCRQLKEKSETAETAIIVLTENLRTVDKVEALYLGADDYLTKPCEYEELIARMEAVMRRTHTTPKLPENETEASIVLELHRIIDEELIVPYYQPIFLLEPLELYGFEGLSRPQTTGKLNSPEELFSAALRYGIYQDLELLVWRKALTYAAEYINGRKLFLNCNPYLVEGAKFVTIKSLFEGNNIKSKDVYLEITERSAITDYKTFFKDLTLYRDYGFKFAIDDVGGGYASLESIIETRPEIVKIDGHIVNQLNQDTLRHSIVKFIVSFCKEHGILSVAEGIETKADLQAVKELGIDAAQGFYLQKPSPILTPNDVIMDQRFQGF